MTCSHIFIALLACCLPLSAALAQDAMPALPDLPSLPALPPLPAGDPFNPLSPTPPASLDPLAPAQAPADAPQSAATLPLPADDDAFDFFQSGKQIRDGQPSDVPLADVGVAPEEEKPVVRPVVQRPKFQRKFNYRKQYLPNEIYNKQYSRENRHLPVAQWESDYDALTFHAAATNNLNGLRALIQSGRNLFMSNAQGESLAMVAARHGAPDTLRYLLAKGVSPQGVDARGNATITHALRTAGAY